MSFISLPSIYSSPPEISSSPAIMRRVVDLPQPEGPTSTMNSLSLISRLKSCTASTPSSVTSRLFFFSFSGSPFFFFLGSMLGYTFLMFFSTTSAIIIALSGLPSHDLSRSRESGILCALRQVSTLPHRERPAGDSSFVSSAAASLWSDRRDRNIGFAVGNDSSS